MRKKFYSRALTVTLVLLLTLVMQSCAFVTESSGVVSLDLNLLAQNRNPTGTPLTGAVMVFTNQAEFDYHLENLSYWSIDNVRVFLYDPTNLSYRISIPPESEIQNYVLTNQVRSPYFPNQQAYLFSSVETNNSSTGKITLDLPTGDYAGIIIHFYLADEGLWVPESYGTSPPNNTGLADLQA